MNKRRKQKLIEKVILLILLTGALSAIYYISTNKELTSFRGEEVQTKQAQTVKDSTKQDQILDCAKKIAQGDKADIVGHVEADWRGAPRIRVVDIL